MKVLFICLGNICRSPTAEGVFEHLVREKKLQDEIEIDSAGTCAHHVGERADSRMRDHALARGFDLKSISRKFDPHKDFEYFDLIITMDDSNFEDIKREDPSNKYLSKIKKMTDFCSTHKERYVPDPYYGGAAGFEKVLDIIEDASIGLLNYIAGQDEIRKK